MKFIRKNRKLIGYLLMPVYLLILFELFLLLAGHHPNNKGAEIMAESVYKKLLEMEDLF